MKDFEYKIGELAVHKHWRITGIVHKCQRWNDYAGVEFHIYTIDFGKEYIGFAVVMMQCTEFELTKLQAKTIQKT